MAQSLPGSAENHGVDPIRLEPASTTATGVADALVTNVARAVLGKSDAIRLVVAALLARGHVLIEDAPGMGKTLLAKALAGSIGGSAGRVQGTVDLLPADITGVTVFDQEHRTWDFHAGPLFNNVLLFDEINRGHPAAQAALLEAMAERHVTVDGVVHDLPEPFLVLATQNQSGDVGTFPLVSGEYDRFAIAISLGLPDRASERSLLRGEGGQSALDALAAVVTPAALTTACAEVDRLFVAPPVEEYVLDIADATRGERVPAARHQPPCDAAPAAGRQGLRRRRAAQLRDSGRRPGGCGGRARPPGRWRERPGRSGRTRRGRGPAHDRGRPGHLTWRASAPPVHSTSVLPGSSSASCG